MNTDFRELLPKDFHGSSRVWIYQSNRLFSLHEALEIEDVLKNFVTGWNSHGAPVNGYANLFFGHFIILIADETSHGVSGCSVDSSVRMIEDIEQSFKVNLFDRLLLAFLVRERVQMIPMEQLSYALQNKFLEPTSTYFNNTVQTLEQLKNNWLISIKESWLGKDARFSELVTEVVN